jgi:hypothetical protein
VTVFGDDAPRLSRRAAYHAAMIGTAMKPCYASAVGPTDFQAPFRPRAGALAGLGPSAGGFLAARSNRASNACASCGEKDYRSSLPRSSSTTPQWLAAALTS